MAQSPLVECSSLAAHRLPLLVAANVTPRPPLISASKLQLLPPVKGGHHCLAPPNSVSVGDMTGGSQTDGARGATVNDARGAWSLRGGTRTAPRGFLVRPHLSLDRFWLAGIRVVEVSAPHGFGKTSQLAQWQREAVVSGIPAISLKIEERDDASRLIQRLTDAAMRIEGGLFSQAFADWIGSCADSRQALTAWLAEVTEAPDEVLLLLDDVDLLSDDSLSALEYLLANAPGNLRIMLGLRPNARLSAASILDGTPMLRIATRELRFCEEETFSVVQQALGEHGSTDLAIRIHEVTEGWPLGVRLAVASQLRNAMPRDLEVTVTTDIGRYFVDTVINRLPAPAAQMLVALAHLDPIHPDLCRTVLGPNAPVYELDRLADESAILTRGESGPWLRLYPTAREILTQRHRSLPQNERRGFAVRASQWYAEHGLFEEGAHQANLAGDHTTAMRLVESGLRAMTEQGRSSEVLGWFSRMPSAEIREHPGFWAPAGWAFAMSNRTEEARRLVELIRQSADVTEAARYEADMILSTCAGYSDDLRELEEFARKWPAPPASAVPSEIVIHAVSFAHRAILSGRTELARQCLSAQQQNPDAISPMSWGFADLLMGLSYLWEGKPKIAYEALRKALARAESQLDRWNRVVSMIAAALAQACLETGRTDEARRLLALRLPILEKQGLPDVVIIAYRALAEIADEEGRQDQAAVQLASLATLGRERGIPRMEASALRGLANLHARHGRIRSAAVEAEKLKELVAALPADLPTAIMLWCQLQERLAMAAVLAADMNLARLEEAVAIAEEGSRLAARLNRGSDLVLSLFLRARALKKLRDARALGELAEATSLCEATGMRRLSNEFSDLGDRIEGHGNQELPRIVKPTAPPLETRSILTPREFDILCRLVDHMSNKEIARSMGLGEETVKWHLKNLYLKLGAGDRKTAVSRARTLGLFHPI